MSDPGDRFNEQEMARILKTASADGTSLPVASPKSGLTVAEIESIAGDRLDVDPRSHRRLGPEGTVLRGLDG